MAYTRKGTLAEVFTGTEPDVLVTPQTLKQNVWYFDGNNVASPRNIGTTTDNDLPFIRNNTEKIRIDNISWTTASLTTNLQIGASGTTATVRFPVNSSYQHGITSKTDGTLSFVVANGSGSTATPNYPISINTSGYIGFGSGSTSPSTQMDLSGGLRIRDFGTTGNLLSVSDTNGNITTVTPASIVSAGNAYIQSGNTFGALGIFGVKDSFGVSIITKNSEAIRIDSDQNVGIGISTPTSKFHVRGGTLTHEHVNIKSEQSVQANIDVDNPSEIVATISATANTACFFDYVIYSGTTRDNARTGTVQAVWSTTKIEYQEFSNIDIGDTSAVTLTPTLNSPNIELVASTNGTSNWTIKTICRTIN